VAIVANGEILTRGRFVLVLLSVSSLPVVFEVIQDNLDHIQLLNALVEPYLELLFLRKLVFSLFVSQIIRFSELARVVSRRV
jgi:hypothetical protein